MYVYLSELCILMLRIVVDLMSDKEKVWYNYKMLFKFYIVVVISGSIYNEVVIKEVFYIV